MLKCPKCKSTNINQFRHPTGKIWCVSCGFASEHKEKWNPFAVEDSRTDLERFVDLFRSVDYEIRLKESKALDYLESDSFSIMFTKEGIFAGFR